MTTVARDLICWLLDLFKLISELFLRKCRQLQKHLVCLMLKVTQCLFIALSCTASDILLALIIAVCAFAEML